MNSLCPAKACKTSSTSSCRSKSWQSASRNILWSSATNRRIWFLFLIGSVFIRSALCWMTRSPSSPNKAIRSRIECRSLSETQAKPIHLLRPFPHLSRGSDKREKGLRRFLACLIILVANPRDTMARVDS